MVGPIASYTAIVHDILPDARKGVAWTQLRLDAVVGWPYMTMDNGLFVKGCPNTFPDTLKAVVIPIGVEENINVEPPLLVESARFVPTLDAAVKSVKRPVLAPCESDAAMVQTMAEPERWGYGARHERDEA